MEKGTKNRVFEHEKESLGSSDSEKLKLKTIADIKNAGFEVDEYERINGAAPLEEKDIRHRILIIKINRLYQRGMDEKVLYDAVRGVWRVSKEKVRTVEYVFWCLQFFDCCRV